MIRAGVEQAGLIAVSIHLDSIRRGKASLEDFIREHEPSVVVYDVAPPYEPSWRYLNRLRQSPLLKDRQFVITSANVARAKELGGGSENVFEILGKPYDINSLVDIVREAPKARKL